MSGYGRRVIYRYRASKPETGHVSFKFHDGAEVVFFAEHWHGEKGWELIIDVLEDTAEPRVDRRFFLCNAGDDLSAIGEFPMAYYVGTHQSKAYSSFLFETTHLSETEREGLRVQRRRYEQRRPAPEERSVTERRRDALRAPERLRAVPATARPPGGAEAPSGPERSAETA